MTQWESHDYGNVQEINFNGMRIVVLRLKTHLYKIIIDSSNPLIPSTMYDVQETNIDVAKSEALYKLKHILRNKKRDIDVLNTAITSAIKDLEPNANDSF